MSRHHPASPDFHHPWLRAGVVFDPTGGIATAALIGISTAVQAASTIAQGNAQKTAMNYQAAQLDQQAGQTRATSQRQAIEQQRTGAYALSRAQAVSAASGADPNSPTTENIEGNLAGESEYNQLTALFNGEERARGQEQQSQTDVYQGSLDKRASLYKAAGTIAQGGETLYSKYGFGSPSGTDTTAGDGGVSSYAWAPWQQPGYVNPSA
jgi:hypothetical protein